MIVQNALDLSWLGNKISKTRKITKMITTNKKKWEEKKKKVNGIRHQRLSKTRRNTFQSEILRLDFFVLLLKFKDLLLFQLTTLVVVQRFVFSYPKWFVFYVTTYFFDGNIFMFLSWISIWYFLCLNHKEK